MVRQAINPTTLAAFSDEMTKIADSAEKALRLLRSGPFSTNVGANARSSFKMRMPTLNSTPPPVGRVTTVGGSSIATGIPGVNIKQPAVGKLDAGKGLLSQQEQLRAGPGHIAQSTPAVPMTAQGQPAKVSTPAPTGGTLGGGSASAASTQSSGQMGKAAAMSEEEAAQEMAKARRASFEGMSDSDLTKELWKNRIKR